MWTDLIIELHWLKIFGTEICETIEEKGTACVMDMYGVTFENGGAGLDSDPFNAHISADGVQKKQDV